MQTIIPGFFTFTRLLAGRVYLVEDSDGLTLIDTSITLSTTTLIRQIQWRRRTLGDVKRIIITHAHIDHIGGLPRLKGLTGAQVIASSIERPYVEGKLAPPPPDPKTLPPLARLMVMRPKPAKGVRVDREVEDGEILPDVFGGLQVIYTPGHSRGHISLWQPEKRVLITGDVVMNAPNGLRLPFAAFTADMNENKRSLKRLAAFDSSIVCFGHGVPLTENAAPALRTFARRVGAV